MQTTFPLYPNTTIGKANTPFVNKTENLSIVFAAALLLGLILPTVASAQASSWHAEYFNSRDLNGSPVIVRDESEINYDWRWQSPIHGTVNNDYFSVRWSRTLDLARNLPLHHACGIFRQSPHQTLPPG
jgi:hypothetical protein